MRLRDALELVPDHRSIQDRRHIWGRFWGGRLRHALRRPQPVRHSPMGADHGVPASELLGFSHGKTPCVATLHRVSKDLDVCAFEAVLGE